MGEAKDTDVHVLGIAGSLRADSHNRALLRAAGELLPTGMTLEAFDLTGVPLFNEDIRALGTPEPVERLRARIAAADALLFVTPEYNFSIPGVLKNAIDWASRPPHQPFAGKPVAIVGASTGMLGSARAQYHLRQVCVFLDMHPINKPELMVARAGEKFDDAGRLHDEATRLKLGEVLAALAVWTRRLRGR